MRGALVLAAALAFSGGAARADMSGLVGNTVIGSTPDNLTRKIQLRADGTFLITVSDGSSASGTWSEQDGKLCYARTVPPPKPDEPPLCVEGFDGHKPGDRWTMPGHNGLVMTATVVSGQ